MIAPSFDRVVEALDRADCLPAHSDGRNNGRLEMMVRCPAHDDRSPSLSVKHEGDRTLVYCHAGCDTERVVEVLGLAMADLFDRRRNTRTKAPEKPAQELTELLGLREINVEVTDVTMFGQGAGASIDVRLSNGETMRFQSIRDMVRPQTMIAELVACAGATPEINQTRCVQIVKLARSLAERVQVDSDDADSRDWGIEFLQQAETIDFRLDDQAERWRAFELLERRNPWSHAREEGGSFASACIVLRDTSGFRLVRSEWFLRYVRSMVPRETPATLRTRMERVGWQRRGQEGRIKATAPGREGTLQWAFWIVPPGWEGGEGR